MFTGLIKHQGILLSKEERRGADGQSRFFFAVRSSLDLADLAAGSSVAVNGGCMTVLSAERVGEAETVFHFFASPETLSKTNMGRFEAGRRLNLETAMRLGEPLGGHLVTGHVDACGRLVQKDILNQKEGGAFFFETPASFFPFLAPKGSVCLDGVSLTVNTTDPRTFRFSVFLIPFTLAHTTLGLLHTGDFVHLEADLIARYVVQALESRRP